MDTKQYLQNKTLGRITLQYDMDSGFYIVSRRYDSTSGEEISPEVFYIKQQSLTSRREEILEELKNIEIILNDMEVVKQEYMSSLPDITETEINENIEDDHENI